MSVPATTNHADQDSIYSVTSLVTGYAVAGAITLVPLIPGARRVLGVGVGDVAIAMAIAMLAFTMGAIVYRVVGAASPVLESFGRVISVAMQASVLSLVVMSGRGDSFFWLPWLAHAMLSGTNHQVRFNLIAFGTGPLVVATLFLVVHEAPGAAAMSVAIGTLGLFLLWYSVQSTRRITALDAERARLAAELAETRLRDERSRIAREIHDGISADLAAMDWRLRSLRDGNEQREVDELVARFRTTSDELRSIVWALRSPARRWTEIASYLRQRLAELAGDTVAIVIEDTTTGDVELAGELAVDFLRSTLELVRNAVRHASATRVRVVLTAGPDELVASVEDDGRGIMSGALERTEGGLANIRHRVTRAGGRLAAAETSPTRFVVAFPIAAPR
jgi:signal transduction histidine kinase